MEITGLMFNRPTGKGGSLGDPATSLEVFQGIQQRDYDNFLFIFLKFFCNSRSGHAVTKIAKC